MIEVLVAGVSGKDIANQDLILTKPLRVHLRNLSKDHYIRPCEADLVYKELNGGLGPVKNTDDPEVKILAKENLCYLVPTGEVPILVLESYVSLRSRIVKLLELERGVSLLTPPASQEKVSQQTTSGPSGISSLGVL